MEIPDSIPDSELIEFKEKFIERYSNLTDFDKFKKFSLSFLRRSIRINTLKISIKDLVNKIESKWKLSQIPWCDEGFYIEHLKKERRDIGNMIEHSLGYFYVQESASMIPPLVLSPKKGEFVLDMAASPGSKSTQISAMMENKGIMIANDINAARMKPLSMNLQRCGVTNGIITTMYGQRFKNFNFDKILLDAPCSGTGAIRKSLKTLRIWNPKMIQRLAHTQKKLIETAFMNLKTQGTLVYSTCSVEPEENEAVVDSLISKFENAKIEDIDLKGLKRSDSILKFEGNVYDSEIKRCIRIWPQDNDTEGFFVAKIKKT
jgi:tRNA (cytosine49-C5)-methyltransferase